MVTALNSMTGIASVLDVLWSIQAGVARVPFGERSRVSAAEYHLGEGCADRSLTGADADRLGWAIA